MRINKINRKKNTIFSKFYNYRKSSFRTACGRSQEVFRKKIENFLQNKTACRSKSTFTVFYVR